MLGMNPKECTSRVGGFPGPSFNAQVNVERMYEKARVDIFVQNSSTSMHSACGVLVSARVIPHVIGNGILYADRERWQHQRKLASYELSTKVMRDFSSAVFKTNAVKLAHIISEAATCDQAIEIQGLFMKASLDSVIKIFLGIELNTMRGTNEEGTRFSNAFDEANANTLYCYVDFSWKIRLFLNIGSEGVLKNNIKVMDQFVYKLIKSKIKTVHNSEDELPKIAQEVKEATNLKDNSSIDELVASLSEEALEKMQYLHATLTETLGLNPAVPLVCLSDDTWPDGFSVKKWNMVGYHIYGMGRMKFLWGDDAEGQRDDSTKMAISNKKALLNSQPSRWVQEFVV
ncbi:hypothetical protein GBA52_006212 [Prunus armeniaca]|nr:hypothetical protein GBA52_006212 [Prunus armeniaca]